ncbi:rhamnogalacturonan acetylesterase [Evansella sp. AB-rgal1]|uniref:rhamnogalacturonan acetylesterase n=1 Tax=Evansella sp. AB-rgal1 TaxID=3242696 RepID=UPI00359E8FC8
MKKKKTTIFLAGDSTVATYQKNQFPMSGWGQMLKPYFLDKVEIQNEALCGRSSKSFIEEGVLDKIEANLDKGDYLFIQFGHNDEKTDDRGTDPYTSYQSSLSQYILKALDKGANPILFTPVERRHFSEENKLADTHGEYPKAMEQLAVLLEIPIIDLREKTKKLFESLGKDKSKDLFVWLKPNESENYPDGISDDTHFNDNGAKQVASLVVEGLKELQLPLTEYLKDFNENNKA